MKTSRLVMVRMIRLQFLRHPNNLGNAWDESLTVRQQLLHRFSLTSSTSFPEIPPTDPVIDSLQVELRKADKGEDLRLKGLLRSHLGWQYLNQRNYDSALFYYRNSLTYRSAFEHSALLASTLNSLGVIFNNIGEPDSSRNYYAAALEEYTILQDTTSMVMLATNLSAIYKNQGLYEQALTLALGVLRQLEGSPPDRRLASTYNTIGSIHYFLKDYALALEYYGKGLEVRQQLDYDKGIGQSYNNIGEVYEALNVYDSSLSHFLKALEVKLRIGDYAGVTLHNIGKSFYHLGHVPEAKRYWGEALVAAKVAQDLQGEVALLTDLGELALGERRYKDAEQYLSSALLGADHLDGLEYLRQALEVIVQLDAERGNYLGAYQHSQRLASVKDSILSKTIAENLHRMQVVYETEKKEQQIAMLQQEKVVQEARLSANRMLIFGLTGSGVLGFIILFLVFRQYKVTQRNKHHVELLHDELQHRIKNNLQMLSSMLTLQEEHLTDGDALQTIRDTASRIQAMSLIHRKLYTKSRSTSIHLKDYITELVNYLVKSQPFKGRVQLQLALDSDMLMDVDQVIPLGLILNEVITNSFKYAFVDHSDPCLTVAASLHVDTLDIKIIDNGRGISPVSSTSPGTFGIKMIKILLKELGGTLSLNSQGGTIVSLVIPISPVWKK